MGLFMGRCHYIGCTKIYKPKCIINVARVSVAVALFGFRRVPKFWANSIRKRQVVIVVISRYY